MILSPDSESITSILQKGTLLLYFLQEYWGLIRSNMSVKRGFQKTVFRPIVF